MALPASLSPTEERAQILRWLSHGAELAWGRHGERATHDHVIWCLVEEAIDILDRQPDQEKRWLTSGTRSGGWNMVGMTISEALQMEEIRILCAMKPYDGNASYKPQRDDVEKAMTVLDWVRFCHDMHNGKALVKAIVALARGGDAEIVYRIYDPARKRKWSRQMIHEVRKRCATYIRAGLQRQGIIASHGTSFVEHHV